MSHEIKTHVDGWITENGVKKRFNGIINRVEDDYALISIRGQTRFIILRRSEVRSGSWASIQSGNNIDFQIGFNYYGAVASNRYLSN